MTYVVYGGLAFGGAPPPPTKIHLLPVMGAGSLLPLLVMLMGVLSG